MSVCTISYARGKQRLGALRGRIISYASIEELQSDLVRNRLGVSMRIDTLVWKMAGPESLDVRGDIGDSVGTLTWTGPERPDGWAIGTGTWRPTNVSTGG